MKIAITGATGYIGRRVVREAAARGYEVTALVRRRCSEIQPYALQYPIEDTIHALEGVDAVVHLAGLAHIHKEEQGDRLRYEAANCQLPLQIAQAAHRAGVARFVHVSSVGVHGSWSKLPVDESSPFAAETTYAASKLHGEFVLRANFAGTPTQLVIIRPPMVYGSESPGNFARLVSLVRKGIPLPFGSVTERRSFVYVWNLVDFLLHCATHPGLAGNYVVGDGSDVSLKELLNRIAIAVDTRLHLLPFPPPLLRVAGRFSGLKREMDSLTRPMLVDWSRAREIAHWSPPFEVSDKIEESAILRHPAVNGSIVA